MYAAVTPNNWAGLLVVLITILGSIVSLVILFNWDDPQRTKEDRINDRARNLLG